MNFWVDLFERVFLPFVGWPQGVAQCLPPLVRPPFGWSTGLRAIPRETERAPFQRVRPALPITSLMWSGLETAPTDAHAGSVDHAGFTGLELQQHKTLVTAGNHGIGACRARQRTALAGLGFDVVDDRADRHRAERHGVARLHVNRLARNNLIANSQALRSKM